MTEAFKPEAVAKKHTVTDSVKGTLPISGNKVKVADLVAFATDALSVDAEEVTFNCTEDSFVFGLEFVKEAARG